MALFFDYKISQKSDVLATAWSLNPAQPVLAVSSGNTVSFYMEEGDRVEDLNVRRGCDCLVIAWHPSAKLLATGWRDGAVSLWSEQERMQREDTVVHQGAIRFLLWSPDGTRLLSGDENAVLGVWKLDQRGRLSPICQYTKQNALTHCVFHTAASSSPAEPNPATQAAPAATPPGIAGPAGGMVPKEGEKPPAASGSPVFLFGGEAGIVWQADDQGNCIEAFQVDGALCALLYYEEKANVVAVTRKLNIAQYRLQDTRPVQIMKAKLSATVDSTATIEACWAGPGILAMVVGESSVRVWNVDQDDNYMLSLADPGHMMKTAKDILLCVDYNPRKACLAGATKDGRVVMWKSIGPTLDSDASKSWEAMPAIEVGGRVSQIQWGPGESLLSVAMESSVSILNECYLHRKIRNKVAVVQLSADRVLVEKHGSRGGVSLKAGIRISGVDVTQKYVLVYNNKKAEIYEVVEGLSPRLAGQFQRNQSMSSLALYNDTVFVAVQNRIEICNFSGVVKQTGLMFTESEGEPIVMDIAGNFLAVATKYGLIKVWDVSRKEPKQVTTGRRFEEGGVSIGPINSIRVNNGGTRVSITAWMASPTPGVKKPHTRLFVYDIDTDTFLTYDFGPKRFPTSHFWDAAEPKLLGCETRRAKGGPITDATREAEVEAVTLFANADNGLLIQDSFPLAKEMEAMLGIQVPFMFFITKPTEESNTAMSPSRLGSKVLRDFVGMENADEQTRDALLTFSYHLTCGNMDEAYKAVKLIENPRVWENMATMCVKTKRLDVAEVCLGNMGHARGARLVREAKQEPEVEAKVAMVAIQLSLLEDAERLYTQCGRYDLLNFMYQAAGQWDKAVQVAQKFDRIHLRTTHYNYAKHLESLGDTAGAIKAYEKSENHRYEVPRMLFDLQMIDDLEKYIVCSDDKDLIKWWAQYCESNASFDKALHYYNVARDYLSLVRVHCFRRDFNKAAEIVAESGNEAAAYHLARQYENQGQVKDAIQLFSKAQRFNHAIRLAKDNNLSHDLMNLALQSNTQPLMLDAARYFEERGEADRAVMLFHKGGNLAKALELAFRSQLFDALRTVADDLGTTTDPEILNRCGDFFVQHGQFEKAAHLYINGGQTAKALDLCMTHNITITEDMAEKMSPKKEGDNEAEVNVRVAVLLKIAKCCKRQGSFHLATKKYTQAGKKDKAMKCLIKSGDTEKIIFFAGVSRQREIYIMAANYLQSLDWHNDPEIMKNIISFYTKAKAFEQLAVFYDACAQVEIDEYRDYDKALDALRQAEQYLDKSKIADRLQRLDVLRVRIHLVDKFVNARKLVKTDPADMFKICEQLLHTPDVDNALRIGDVYALLIEYYFTNQQHQRAYQLIEEMRDRNIILSPYLDQDMVEAIYNAMGIEAADDAAQPDDINEDIADDP